MEYTNKIKRIKYTLEHNKKIIELYKKYVSKNVPLKIYFHDLDKVFLYILFSDKKYIQKLHRSYSKHHVNNIHKQKSDLIEMILDWESARYTKPDKPLNAYETCLKYYPEMLNQILPIIKELKILK